MIRAGVRAREDGAALLLALLTTMLLAGVAALLIVVSTTETLISTAHRHTLEAAYAAESAFSRAVRDLDAIADWSLVLALPPANLQSTFSDGQSSPRTPDGRTLDLAGLTAARQADSGADSPGLGPDAPGWRLFGHASLASVLPPLHPSPPAYVVVWVADDGFDGDGDPARDANGRLQLFAEAHGIARTRQAVQGVIARGADGTIRVLTMGSTR